MSTPIPAAAALPAHREPVIRLGEPLPTAMQHMALGQFDRILVSLGEGQPDRDAGIHTARKAMKRLRALIRLVRDEVGYPAYRAENVVLRDTGRLLAAPRDAYVQLVLLDRVAAEYGTLLAPDAFATTRRHLAAEYEAARHAVLDNRQLMARVRVTLGTARARFAAWDAAGAKPTTALAARRVHDRYSAIGPGLHRVYRRGRRAMLRAYEEGSGEAFHEWRKRVKYLRYQMEALEPIWPEMIGAHARSLDELGEVLGDEHDLLVLGDMVRDHPEATADERERTMLLSLVYRSRMELQWRARPLGWALYAEEPDHFAARIGAYYEAARLS